MSSKRTSGRALALVVGSALALSACATSSSGGASGGGPSTSASSAPITVTLGYAQEFAGYNVNFIDGNSLANQAVVNQVLRGFTYYAPDGTVTPDKDFGTFEKTADDPLTVKYTINDKAVWSDGKPVECDDMVLSWLSSSALTGDKGFSPVSTTGYDQMNKPDCKAGDKTVTVTYKKPFADWQTLFGWGAIVPAHVVEQQGGLTKTFVDLADTPTSPDLAKAITFWNSGWQFNPGELKKDITPSMGPYDIDSWTAGQSLTLKANPKWWGTPPKAQTIVFRYIADDAQSQALQNGEVNIIEPQPQVDIAKQLQALGDKIKPSFGDQYSFEHMDFNFKTVFADRRVREAFAKCIPRQQILDNLIKPQNPNAHIMESRILYPFQPTYNDFISGFGAEAYDKTDIPGAKALLKAAGKTNVTVKVGWRKNPAAPNKRRADTIALLQASCTPVGFKVVDGGTDTFFSKELSAGQWDVALFAWIGSPTVTSNASIYQTKAGGKGGQNNGQYSNAQVDKWFDELNVTLDLDKQVALEKQIDAQLWKDLATVPLFVFPNIVATDLKVQNVKPNATQMDITWNAQDWSLAQ